MATKSVATKSVATKNGATKSGATKIAAATGTAAPRGAGHAGRIHVGIGGWNFEPWRGVFYPKGLPQAKELEYAATHLTSIEINATFYGSQKPESFRKWAATVPDGFVFSVKGPRFATNRRVLAEAVRLDQALSR